MRKADVEFHADYGRSSRPAVNVKVRGSYRNVPLPLDLGSVSSDGGKTWETVRTDPRFTVGWVDENLSEADIDGWFGIACDLGWESLQSDAEELWGPSVEVYSEGRSGGWAVVDGFTFPPFDTWDAIDLGRWARFARFARDIADDIPRAVLDLIYANAFEPWAEDRIRPDTVEAFEREGIGV